jgi:hypothetical protein
MLSIKSSQEKVFALAEGVCMIRSLSNGDELASVKCDFVASGSLRTPVVAASCARLRNKMPELGLGASLTSNRRAFA